MKTKKTIALISTVYREADDSKPLKIRTNSCRRAVSVSPAPCALDRTRRPSFTIVELLVVIAIISILAALLLPALKGARDQGFSAKCISNLKQFGLAQRMYMDDWNGYFVPDYVTYWWLNSIAPYLGYEKYAAPCNSKTETLFACPKEPKGLGWYPSYSRNSSVQYKLSDGTIMPRKFTEFSNPSAKVFMADGAVNSGIIGGGQFHPIELDPAPGTNNPRISIRHAGRRCMILFIDAHINGYDAPPIPPTKSDSEGNKWLAPNTADPSGL